MYISDKFIEFASVSKIFGTVMTVWQFLLGFFNFIFIGYAIEIIKHIIEYQMALKMTNKTRILN